jgi:diguanylate cyclase (GGDEF)-like protein
MKKISNVGLWLTSILNRLRIVPNKVVDYQALNQYIIGIHSYRDLGSILCEISKCLKQVLDYRMLAFAVSKNNRLEAWMDPFLNKQSFLKLIQKDFSHDQGIAVHSLVESDSEPQHVVAYDSSGLKSYVLMGKHFSARLYLVPNQELCDNHIDIMRTLLKAVGIALSNYLNLKHLENIAALDGLTNCYNRRELGRLLGHHVANAHRHGKHLSILMFDIDHFKRINDTHGHQNGDKVLIMISKMIHSHIRKGDYLARYGGEEFVVVLPHTKMTRAMELGERLRRIIEKIEIQSDAGKTIKVTASFGISTLRQGMDKHHLLNEADARLYRAKASGRNCVMPTIKLKSKGPKLIKTAYEVLSTSEA